MPDPSDPGWGTWRAVHTLQLAYDEYLEDFDEILAAWNPQESGHPRLPLIPEALAVPYRGE